MFFRRKNSLREIYASVEVAAAVERTLTPMSYVSSREKLYPVKFMLAAWSYAPGSGSHTGVL